jgi:hypothetical protein
VARGAVDRFRRGLLRRMGLESPPADPEQWVPVFSGLLDDVETGFSEQAARIRDALTEAGIDARQQPYVLPDHHSSRFWGGPGVTGRIEIAVVVRRRDQPRAEQLLATRDAPADG